MSKIKFFFYQNLDFVLGFTGRGAHSFRRAASGIAMAEGQLESAWQNSCGPFQVLEVTASITTAVQK